MAQSVENIKTFTGTTALSAFRLVKLTASSGSAVEYATASDSDVVGSTERECLITANVPVRLRGPWSTAKCTVAGAVAAGATLYTAAAGKVDDSGTYAIGTALEAGSADGAVIEVLLDAGTGSAPGTAALANFDATNDNGVPFLMHKTASTTATDFMVAPRKLLVVDCFMYSRDTTASNITLDNATDAFTAATAKGTADDVKVPFAVDDTHTTIASGADIGITLSVDAGVDVTLLCLPVA